MLRRFVPFFFALAIFGAGCFQPSLSQTPIVVQPTTQAERIQEEALAPGFERLTFAYGTGTNDVLVLYRFDERFSFSFRSATSPQLVSAWQTSVPESVAVMNGVYFNEDFSPSGSLVTSGTRVGTRSFSADRSAILTLAPNVKIIDTRFERFGLPDGQMEYGQSYPLLITDGQPAIATDSGKSARRAFVGLDVEKNVYLGISPGNITLFELARALADMEIAWTRVLNMDGGPSAGIVSSLDPDGSIDSWTEVPNVIVVTK